MGLGISWKKAAIISAVVHLIILFIAVIFFVVVPAIQEQETYEVDLTQSVLDDGGSVTLVVAAVIGHLYSQNHCLQMKWRQEQRL